MVRRRSTVRFRNGAQVDDLIRKDSNAPWMPVGTNGCHQGTESPATASPERPYPQGIRGYPEQPVRSRIPSQPADHSAGQARTGTGAVRPRDCLDAPGGSSPGRAPGPRDGMVRRGRRQPGAVIMSAGGAPRPRSRRGTRCGRATSGQCRVPVSYLRVCMTCSRLGPGWPGASPVIRRHSRGCSCGPAGGAAACPRPVSGQLGTNATVICVTSAMAATGVRQSRRAVPSRAGSAGVILRG